VVLINIDDAYDLQIYEVPGISRGDRFPYWGNGKKTVFAALPKYSK